MEKACNGSAAVWLSTCDDDILGDALERIVVEREHQMSNSPEAVRVVKRMNPVHAFQSTDPRGVDDFKVLYGRSPRFARG